MMASFLSTTPPFFASFVFALLVILNVYPTSAVAPPFIESSINQNSLLSLNSSIASSDFALVLVKSGAILSPTSTYRTFIASLSVAAKRDFEGRCYGIKAPGELVSIDVDSNDVPPAVSQLRWKHVVWALSSWAEIMSDDVHFREADLKIFWKQKEIGTMTVKKSGQPSASNTSATPGSQVLSLPPIDTTNKNLNNTSTGSSNVTTISDTANELSYAFSFVENVPNLKGRDMFMSVIKSIAAMAFYPVEEFIPGFDFKMPQKYNCEITFASAGPDPIRRPILQVGYAIDGVRYAADFMVEKTEFKPLRGKMLLNDNPVGYMTIRQATGPGSPT